MVGVSSGAPRRSVRCSRSHHEKITDQFEFVSASRIEWWIPCMRGVTRTRLSVRSSASGNRQLLWWNAVAASRAAS